VIVDEVDHVFWGRGYDGALLEVEIHARPSRTAVTRSTSITREGRAV